MTTFRRTFEVRSSSAREVLDLTDRIQAVVRESGISDGLCNVFTPHATAAVTINENDDPNIGVDLQVALRKMIPDHDDWLHDRIDGNAAAHIKAAIIGPSETLPVQDGRLLLGTWQNVFLCELDGPRAARRVVVTVTG